MMSRSGIYVIHNVIDPLKTIFKIGSSDNLGRRIMNYYTYFPEGADIWYACTLKGYISKVELARDYEWKLFKYIKRADNNSWFYDNPGRRTGTELINIPRYTHALALAIF